MEKNILITGGAGYLGSVLTKVLLAQDHFVTVADSYRHGVPSLAHLVGHPRLTLINTDVTLKEHPVWARIQDFDVLIPLAAIVGAGACDADKVRATITNFAAVQFLVQKADPGQRMIYPNTNSGYGIGGKELCTEEDELKPISLYGTTKVEAEKVVLTRENSVSLRLATLFGPSPRMRLDLMVNDFVYKAVRKIPFTLYEGHFRRNFLHVHDASRAIALMVNKTSLPERAIYNVGDSKANMTKRELCELIASIVPGFNWREGKGEDPDKRDYIVSNAKIEDLWWEPQTTLAAGIQELVQVYRMPYFLTDRSWRNA